MRNPFGNILGRFQRRPQTEDSRRRLPSSTENLGGWFGVLQQRLQAAKDAKGLYHTDWATWQKYYDHDGQKNLLLEYIDDEDLQRDIVTANFIFSSIETAVSTLLQSTPSWYVVAGDNTQDDVAEALSIWLQGYWDASNLTREIAFAYRNAFIIGTGVLGVDYDMLDDDVAVRSIDPFWIYPDPLATDERTAAFIAVRRWYSGEVCRQRWSRFDESRAAKAGPDESGQLVAQQTVDYERKFEIWDIWYDFGRKRVIYTGDLVLDMSDNPLPSQSYPFFFFRMPNHYQADFWGKGLVPYLIDLQMSLNKQLTRIAWWERYNLNPIYVADAGVDIVDTTPGSLWRTHGPDQGVAALRPNPLTPEALAVLNQTQHDFDVVSGVHEIMRGQRPASLTSGVSLEVLQQNAQTRLTGPARDWTFVLAHLGQCVLEHMQAYYAEPRTLPLLKGGEPFRATVTPDQLAPLAPTGENDAETGMPVLEPEIADYHVVMQAEGDLPLSPAAQADLAFRLRELQTIDDEALLDAVKFRGRDQVKRRMMAREQAQMQAQEDLLRMQAETMQQMPQQPQQLPPEGAV